MKKKSVEILANLKNIVILDCDKDALYKKVSLVSDLFTFQTRKYLIRSIDCGPMSRLISPSQYVNGQNNILGYFYFYAVYHATC